MANTTKSIFALLFISIVVVAGRDIPSNTEKNDVKQPENFVSDNDRSYVIPGIGRFMRPKSIKDLHPFTYNPVTGTNSGFSFPTIPSGGITVPGIGAPRRNYIPGADDTFVPNPGFEVPIPRVGGNIAGARP